MVGSTCGGWWQGVRRGIVFGLVGFFLLLASGTSEGQRNSRQRRAHRETNASRQARVARIIQETYSHKWEAFGGGGYLRWKSGEFTKKNNEVSWAGAANYYLSPKLAIVGEAQGSFGSAHALLFNGFPQAQRPQINEYFFTGGASYRFYMKQKVALSAQGTGGVAWGIFSGGAKGLTGPQVGLWQDGFRPAFTVSASADYNVFPNIALRFSPTYVGTNFGSSFQNNLGFNAGVVYRFGKQR